ncbi:MAG: 5-keto-L-gluconate epimerase [Candidatus Caldatribacteriaceae bacterium]
MKKLSFAVSLQKTRFGAIAFGDSFAQIVLELQKLGYQGIELAIRNPEEIDQEKSTQTIHEAGLVVPAIGTGQAFLEEGLSLSSLKNEIRQKAVQRIKSHILFAAPLNSLVIIGLIRGNLPKEDKEREKALDCLKESLLECSVFAQKKGVRLVIEPLNRYEVNFLNTVEETLSFVSSLGCPNIGILADSFHMNIEETDLYQSISKTKGFLWHFHIADSNRWAPGFGHTDFIPLFKALRDIQYQGFISAEILQKPNFQEAARQTIQYCGQLLKEYNIFQGGIT